MTEDGPAPAADSEREEGDHEGDARASDRKKRRASAVDDAVQEGEPAESADPPEEGPVESDDGRAVGEADRGATSAVRSRTGSGDDDGAKAEATDDATGAVDVDGAATPGDDVPEDVRSYDRFQKVDRASYDRVNEFLRDRTYVTAREWAIARLCADFRTATGVEMTKIGENLPELVPFMTDTYSPQAVNQARSAFEDKVRMAGATFLYGAMSGFFTADELDDLMYEVTEVAKFLLEVEGVELTVDEELDAEDRISAVMREVRRASEELRFDEVSCPHCGGAFRPEAED